MLRMQYTLPKEPVDNDFKNMQWLRQQLVNYPDRADIGLSIEDLSQTVFEMLKSTREYSKLQNDLFELLEYDGFEVIPTLLENRRELNDNVAEKKPCEYTNNNRHIHGCIPELLFADQIVYKYP